MVETAAPRRRWRRHLPLAFLLIGLALFFALGLHRSLSLETLAENRAQWREAAASQPLLAALLIVLGYAAVTALSLPIASLVSISVAAVIGTLTAVPLIVLGATSGATFAFFAMRSSLAEVWRRRAAPFIPRLEEGFRRNAFFYMLTLRLIPLFPFWLVNLVPALVGVRPGVFVAGTLIGIVPGTIAYCQLGEAVGAVIEAGGVPSLETLLDRRVLLGLVALGLLALLPIVARGWTRRHG